MAKLDRIDVSNVDPRVQSASVVVACDVNNPLCGPTGASAVFGPQKGATPEIVAELDAALSHFADILERDLGADVRDRAGAGAAGGLGAGLMALLSAELKAGVDIVLDAVRLGDQLDGADLVITGEGQIDASTVFNKAPVGVARLASQRGIPVFGLAGSLGDGFEEVHNLGIDAVFTLVDRPMTLDEALADTNRLVASLAEEATRAFAAGAKAR